MDDYKYIAERVLEEELDDLRERIAGNIRAAGENVTGKTIESMQTEVAALSDGITVGTLYARPYFAATETGTRPWSKQYIRPPKFFIDIIREWIDNRGLDLSAGAVASTIMRRGSKLFREGGRTDIYSNEIPATLNNIADRLAGLFTIEITENLGQ